jgi:hypothetical protein
MYLKPPTPSALIDAHGRVATGMFAQSVQKINGRSFDYRTPMGAPASAFARHFHYKQFQYFGVLSDSVLAGCALAHTAYVGLAFVYVYDTHTRRMVSETFRLPLGRGLTMGDSPVAGESVLSVRGADIRMDYVQHPDGTLGKTLAVQTAKGISISASMLEAAPFEVQALCTQTGINGWTYANKVAGLAVSGSMESALGKVSLAQVQAMGHHDFSAGYMRRETFWNWACFSGQAGGHALGLNLSCGVNETSYSENCLWVDGLRVPLGLAQFDYERSNPDSPWHVRTSDGAINLVFTPAGLHTERLNLGLFATRFLQFFGQFSGTVQAHGKTIAIHHVWGFVEDQYAKW